MNAAKAAFEADPKNKALEAKFNEAKQAYDTAKAAADDEEDDEDPNANPANEDDPPGEDDSKWDDKTKALIKKLRNENAKHRTKGKELASTLKTEKERSKAILKAAGVDVEDEKPEEKIEKLTNSTNELAFRNTILEVAIEHGVPKDKVKYFTFLVQEATSALEEGEELSEDDVKALAKEAKGMQKKKANSSINGAEGDEGGDPPPAEGDKITLDSFCSMSITEKSKLYEKQPAVYEALAKQAKAKKRLI